VVRQLYLESGENSSETIEKFVVLAVLKFSRARRQEYSPELRYIYLNIVIPFYLSN
jgi:hypothetical protein